MALAKGYSEASCYPSTWTKREASMKTLKHIWNSWDPQSTWREGVRLFAIETTVCLAFIGLFEAIF
jgi:hypothetical protein